MSFTEKFALTRKSLRPGSSQGVTNGATLMVFICKHPEGLVCGVKLSEPVQAEGGMITDRGQHLRVVSQSQSAPLLEALQSLLVLAHLELAEAG